MFGKYKVEDEKEVKILNIIQNMCSKKETEVLIDPSNWNTFIRNTKHHYDIVILPSSVIITNSVFSLRESFSDKFLSILKETAHKRASKDRAEILEEILSREKEMLTKIKNNLDEKINNICVTSGTVIG